jgi:hypothetical protein
VRHSEARLEWKIEMKGTYLEPELTGLALLIEVTAEDLAAPDVDTPDMLWVIEVEFSIVDFLEIVFDALAGDPLVWVVWVWFFGVEGNLEF